VGENEKNLKFEKKIRERLIFVIKIGSYTNTKIGPWFRFPIPKPGLGRTLHLISAQK
jgi:hypothetical protein